MHEAPNRNPGALFRFSSRDDADLIQQGIAMPNGLAWAEGGNTFYFVDSIACSIFQATSTADDKPENIRLFAKTPIELRRPAGIAMDKEEAYGSVSSMADACCAMADPELIQYPDAGDLYAISPAISGNSRYCFKE